MNNKKTKKHKATLKINLKKATSKALALIILFSILALISNQAFATGGSIAMETSFPNNEQTYTSIDRFIEQITAVNTNTTFSVSIDQQPPIPMTYQGTKNEIASGDSQIRGWHTWQATVPPITTPGNHTYQFFSHYYVWQGADQYWAEFNAYSNIHSFTIEDQPSNNTQLPQPTTNNNLFLLILVTVLAAPLILLIAVVRQKYLTNSPHTSVYNIGTR
jgi:hypothetical protein